ncbi:TetR/AcrR family transcriptional regulator [Streptoalloteichus hindustanus]|uniref:Transcriptional regulator, TetR family n=1 Tax=Streptoalloteichus hindustanus TaxID=2017 RepID=A0A1M5NE46_STRHI|nr:TetR family transcriptional regulator [Streptoalloteichus hindustanus]SHG87791.1 transcriptional regulator, TetR family [Streptoalloteichus hindustanus]
MTRGEGRGARRRQEIVDAATRVVAERGVAGLTHRVVAQAAEVPLGSTTYYFATLDDLIEAVLLRSADDMARQTSEFLERSAPDDVPHALTALVERWLGPERECVVVAYELYLAALHRPALRTPARRWMLDCTRALAGHVPDPLTAEVLTHLLNSVVLDALVTGAAPGRDELLAQFRSLLPDARREHERGASTAE